MSKPRYLVVGPGGVKGFYMLGALHKLWSEGLLDEIEGYAGSSVGAMIVLLINCGYAPHQIMNMANKINLFMDFFNVSLGARLAEMKSNFGITSNSGIRHALEVAVVQRYGRVVTMEELYQTTGCELYITTQNISTGLPVYLSHYTHPDLDVVTAVLLSTNIPFLFYRMLFRGDIYIDGGFCDPIPIYPFDDGRNAVIAIYVKTNHPVSIEDPFIKTMTGYVHKMLMTSIHRLSQTIIANSSTSCHFVEIAASSIDTTGLSNTIEDKAKMIIEGLEAATLYVGRLRSGDLQFVPDHNFPSSMIRESYAINRVTKIRMA